MQVLKNGRDRGIVKQPSKVAGPLSSSSYTILGIAAGFQHSLAIASEPSDKERVDRALVVNEKPFAKPLTVNAPSEKVEEKKAAIAEKVADKVVDNQKAQEKKEEKATVVVEKKKEEARVDKAAIAAKETKVDKAAIIAKERKEATVVAQESEVTDPFGADPSYDNPLEVDGYYYEDYDDYEEEEDWSGYEDDEEDIYGDELYADTYTDDFFTEGNKADKAAQSTVVDGKQATNETVADKEDRLWREEEVSLLGEGAVMEVGDLYLEEGYADLDGKEASADKASASSANATSAALIGVQSKSSDHWRRHVLYASVQAPKNIADIKVTQSPHMLSAVSAISPSTHRF